MSHETASHEASMDDVGDVREAVRRRYAAAAAAATRPGAAASCCGTPSGETSAAASCCGTPSGETSAAASCCGPSAAPARSVCGPTGHAVFGAALYENLAEEDVLKDAVSASLGCGVPTAVADLHPGEVVLDLGSGAGADVLIAARRVAPGGRAIGLDMTPEMLALARRNAAAAGVDNVELLEGYLEEIPLCDDSVDVVISNCVINLAADKSVVLREAARVLRPGGRLAVSDVVADAGMDAKTRADMAAWTGCIAGALTEADYRIALADAGFEDVEIVETHRVHPHAAAALIRARLDGRTETERLVGTGEDGPGVDGTGEDGLGRAG